jgi:hypothetical protein
MVAPLTVIALLWDRRNWGGARLLATRTVTLRVGSVRRTLLLSTVLSAGLTIFMGALTVVLALGGESMATDGWQLRLTAVLGHAAAVVQDALGFVPGWSQPCSSSLPWPPSWCLPSAATPTASSTRKATARAARPPT